MENRMTKAAGLTKAQIARLVKGTVEGAAEAGLKLDVVRITPDGSILLLPAAAPSPVTDTRTPEPW
jgi:hypothetical protein